MTRPLRELLAAVPGAELAGDGGLPVADVTHDSRKVGPGALFVAIRGLQTDGNRFVEAAVRKGASAVVSEEPPREGFTDEVRARLEQTLVGAKRQEALSAYIGRLRSQAEVDGEIRHNPEILRYDQGEEGDEEEEGGPEQVELLLDAE